MVSFILSDADGGARLTHAGVTGLDAAAQPGGPLPRGVTVVLAVTGLLVSVLAQRQFASILGPVLLPLILVIGVHPMTGILRPLPGTAVAGGDRHGDRAGGRDPNRSRTNTP